jgi:hypothetical protein
MQSTTRWCLNERLDVEPYQPKVTAVELYLKAGRTPFDGTSVYLKTGKPFRAALKYRTDLYLMTGQVCT